MTGYQIHFAYFTPIYFVTSKNVLFWWNSFKSLFKIRKKHLPAGVVWDEVATVLDTGLTMENKIRLHNSLIDVEFSI